MTDERKSGSQIEGEGSYEGSKKFQKAQQEFASGGKVDEKPKEAADALDGPEGAELAKARRKSAEGKSRSWPLRRWAPNNKVIHNQIYVDRKPSTLAQSGNKWLWLRE